MRGFALRFLGALLLVLATYNPEGWSFTHWVMQADGISASLALTGTLLTIGWVIAFTTSWRAVGVIGTGLLAALVGTLLWTIVDWTDASLSARGINYLVLTAIALVLAVGTSWAGFKLGLSTRLGREPGSTTQ